MQDRGGASEARGSGIEGRGASADVRSAVHVVRVLDGSGWRKRDAVGLGPLGRAACATPGKSETTHRMLQRSRFVEGRVAPQENGHE
jgi:hypothetical protein